MDAQTLRRYAAIIGILAGVSAIVGGFVAHAQNYALGYPWRPFITVFHNTAVLSAVGILIGLGIVMIIGGLITFRSLLWGGIVVVTPAIIGLVYCYTHEWHRLTLLYYWAAPVVLAWVSGIFGGFSLHKVIEPYDEMPELDKPFQPGEGDVTAP